MSYSCRLPPCYPLNQCIHKGMLRLIYAILQPPDETLTFVFFFTNVLEITDFLLEKP